MACCEGAPQGAQAATACGAEEDNRLGLKGGHRVKAVSRWALNTLESIPNEVLRSLGRWSVQQARALSSASASAFNIPIMEDGRASYLPCVSILWQGWGLKQAGTGSFFKGYHDGWCMEELNDWTLGGI